MLRVGLTGGLACGKSTVAQMFAARGAYVLDADILVRELMLPGEPVYAEVVRVFGREILKTDGSERVNRPLLAEAAFAGGKIKLLNDIVHPAVLRAQQRWMEEAAARDPQAIAVVEAALIVEAGSAGQFDKLVVVTCNLEQKIDRFVQRSRKLVQQDSDEKLRQQAQQRIAAQMSDEEKCRAADYVIRNDGDAAALQKEFDRVFAELQRAGANGAVRQAEAGNPENSI